MADKWFTDGLLKFYHKLMQGQTRASMKKQSLLLMAQGRIDPDGRCIPLDYLWTQQSTEPVSFCPTQKPKNPPLRLLKSVQMERNSPSI